MEDLTGPQNGHSCFLVHRVTSMEWRKTESVWKKMENSKSLAMFERRGESPLYEEILYSAAHKPGEKPGKL